MRGNTLDIILIVMAIGYAIVGYRRGFILGVLSFAGFISGAVIGLQLAPVILSNTPDAIRLALGIGIVLGMASVGQVAAFYLGAKLRDQLRTPHAQVVDGVGGGAVSVLALLLVAWMLAAPLASAPAPWVASQVRRSAIIHSVDQAIPDPVRSMYAGFATAISDGAFPEVFGGLTPTQVSDVPAPDPALARSPVVRDAEESVVKVVGDASDCNRRSSGTGFVYAPGRVMTNAHVVAGTDSLRIEHLGDRYRATVVLFDPELDIAVLKVSGLDAPELAFDFDAPTQADAIVVGYPQGGPYTPVAARIRQRDTIDGPDIYDEATVEREVYAIRAEVRPGNSGGPLLSVEGDVYGVIFAAAADDPDTAFALTSDQVNPAAESATTRTAEVATGDCHS